MPTDLIVKPSVPVVLRPSPFKLEAIPFVAMPGQSLESILLAIPNLPPEIWTHGIIRVGGVEVPREYWSRVKPKAGTSHLVHIGIRVSGGGGGGGGKSIFTTIAAIALVIAVTAISGGALGPQGFASISSTLFAAGSTSAALAAAGVSIVGALALSALTPTASPTPGVEASADETIKGQLGSASIQGNALAPFDPIPFVAGTHRVSPPHLIQPWSESVNDDQYVYTVVGLNGAHLFEDIRINGAPIEDFPDVVYEIRDVVNDDTDITLITQQVFENQVGLEVSPHKLNDDSPTELQDAVTPSNSYPIWRGGRSRLDPHEIWLSFAWAGLVAQTDTGTERAGTPLRLRMRRVGDTEWINLPEFHAQRERLESFRGVIKLRFQAPSTALTRLDQDVTRPPWSYALFVEDADNDEGFAVNSYFDLTSSNNADNVGAEDGVAVIWLDPEIFPRGIYDIQAQRGYGYVVNSFTPSTYLYDAAIPYFFTHTPASDPPDIREDQAKIVSGLNLLAISSVWDEYPLGAKGMSLIALKAKNIAVNSLSVLATGYANVWDGTDWDTFAPTRNPAAWWRYLALGNQSARAIFIEAQLDDPTLQDFYEYCGDDQVAAATFDGSSYLTRGAGLTGAADSKLMTLCGWFYISGTETSLRWILEENSEGEATRFVVISGNIFESTGADSSNTQILRAISSPMPYEQWAHIMYSVDMANPANHHLYINGQEALGTVTTYTDAAIDFTETEWSIGAEVTGINGFHGSMAELWFAPGVYIDFSVEANRLKFIDANGRPADLGADGSTPTGAAPLVYLSGSLPGWITNKGSGGGFTENGTLTSSIARASTGLPYRECNAFFNGRRGLAEVLRIVAATGRASVRMSDKIGVVIDRDRSEETPIQLFTQRNAKGLTIRRAFPRIPDGFRVGFNNEDNDYLPEEIFVYRKPVTTAPSNIESINYTGITSQALAIDRAYLDFAQLIRRGRLYTMDVDIENLYCTKGSLVLLVYDTLARHYDAARVISVQTSGPNVTGLTLDTPLRLALIGERDEEYPAGVVVQLKDGTTITEEIDEETDTDTITFTTPFTIPDDDILEERCLVACGPLSKVEKRMLVLSIAPLDDNTATLVLVDVADPIRIIAPGPDPIFSPFGERIMAPF